MKLCMIGCGDFARRFHGPAQRLCAAHDPALELAGCCDVDVARARSFGEAFGFARCYTDLTAMLAAERPDAVVLAVPPAAVGAAAGLVLGRGFPTLLEKPPGLNQAELAGLIATAARGRAPAQVGFNRRYMPIVRRARAIIERSFASTPVTRIEYEMTRCNRWDADFSTTAVHAVDGVGVLAGSPFRTAQLDYHPVRVDGREAVSISVDLECLSGLRAHLEIQPVAGHNRESARVHALGQSLEIRLPYMGERSEDGILEHWRDDQMVELFSDADLEAYDKMGVVEETKSFLAAVRSGAGFSPGLPDCLQQVALMEAIRLRQQGPLQFQPL